MSIVLGSYQPQTPAELHSLFGQYFAKKDLEGLSTLFDENAIFILDEQGKQARGHDEIKQALKAFMARDAKMVTKNVSIHINGNDALVRSEWEIPGIASGTALEVMHYVNAGWLYIIDNPNGF